MIRASIAARRIGTEGQPIAIVDGFHPDPDALRAHAAGSAFDAGLNHYPGIRAALPESYARDALPVIARAAREAWGHGGGVDLLDASFSIVTTPPAELGVPQRLPHADAPGCFRDASLVQHGFECHKEV